ncbi:MAG: hypothetical protein WCC17_15020 [Candidatus Nitrosopolaris sp.]
MFNFRLHASATDEQDIDSTKCIGRVANKVNISEKNVVRRGVSAGKDLMGLAAAVLYSFMFYSRT